MSRLANQMMEHYDDPIPNKPATTVTIAWEPAIDATLIGQIQYTYTVDGGTPQPTCSQYCFGTTALRIPRPTPGSSVRIVVTAIDNVGLTSSPSNELVVSN